MNDKQIVQESQDSFDVLVLQGNLAISAPGGLSSWLELDKPFWIDPITYAFAASPVHLMSRQRVRRGSKETTVDFKRTFRSLAETYEEPFDRVISERRELAPSDFEGVDLGALVARVVEWQKTVLAPASKDQKYFPTETREPLLLTVPFFPLQRHRRGEEPPWLDLNLRLVQEAAATYDASRLAAGMLIETGVFDSEVEIFNRVVDAYLDLPAEHIWLWVSDNEEVEMSLPRAERLISVIDRLRAAGKQVHQAFGGSFSSLLLSRGLTSVSHGVGYWEHKNWEPLAGGGLPTLRYFYPPLRRRLRFLDADQVVESTGIDSAGQFHDEVCGCDTCRAVMNGELAHFARFGQVEVRRRVDRWGNTIEYDVPLPESLYLTKRHYLEAKAVEVAEAAADNFDPDEVLELALRRNRDQDIDDLQHLVDWQIALSEAS